MELVTLVPFGTQLHALRFGSHVHAAVQKTPNGGTAVLCRGATQRHAQQILFFAVAFRNHLGLVTAARAPVMQDACRHNDAPCRS